MKRSAPADGLPFDDAAADAAGLPVPRPWNPRGDACSRVVFNLAAEAGKRYARPAVLPRGYFWVTVVKVEGGTGVAADELAWANLVYPHHDTAAGVNNGGADDAECALHAAARLWFCQTEQSTTNVKVTMRVECPGGNVWQGTRSFEFWLMCNQVGQAEFVGEVGA